MSETALPVILYASLGGTITMTGSGGVVPSLTADDVIAAAPGIERIAVVDATTVTTIPGASLDFAHLEQLLVVAREAVKRGAGGVVVSQGTDTIEESAYYLDLRWRRPEPLIVTGAMRHLQALSPDGPANLSAAMTVAAAADARERGVLVVVDQEVHAAARVRKEHSTALGAFRSQPGPVGVVIEGRFQPFWSTSRSDYVAGPLRDDVRVASLATGLDDDGDVLRAVVGAGVDGVVIDAFGAGHVSHRLADAVGEAAPQIPVVVSSRTGGGRTLTSTYGFPGSERDLVDRGALLAGWLDGRKSRVLLHALLAADVPADHLRRKFVSHADFPSQSIRSVDGVIGDTGNDLYREGTP